MGERKDSRVALFFWQTLLLAALAGGSTLRNPAFGVLAFLLCAFFQRVSRRRFLCLILAFFAGAAFMGLSLPKAPDMPSWAGNPHIPVLVEGDVASVTGLPGGRMRILLENVRLADRAENDSAAPLPGRVSLTMDKALLDTAGYPVAGQKLIGRVRLYPVGGSGNFGVQGMDLYWAGREVWRNARIKRHRQGAEFLQLKEGSGLLAEAFRLRWKGREALHAALLSPAREEKSTGKEDPDSLCLPDEAQMSQGKAMLLALLFGDRSCLSPRTVDLFTRAGLIHSLALSGQHLALASMAGMVFILLLSLVVPRLFLALPKRMLMVAAGIPFAVFYLFLGGAPLSIIRAALMMLAAAVFLYRRRPFTSLDVLFAAVLPLFLWWPLALFDLSAQLSVTAVAGILLAMPLTLRICQSVAPPQNMPLWRRLPRLAFCSLLATLVISFAAQMAVLPFLITVFGVVGPCFWLNVIWLPVMAFVILPFAALGLMALFLKLPLLAGLLLGAAAWPADRMLEALSLLESSGGALPFLQCPRPSVVSSLGYIAVLATLLCAWRFPRRKRTRILARWCAAGLLLMLGGQLPYVLDDVQTRLERRVTLTVLDVGQGQALLVSYPGGRVLVDGGGSSSPFFDVGRNVLAPALTDGRLPRLDAVIVSHNDMDHIRGLRWIMEHFSVGALYWSQISAERADGGDARKIHELALSRGIPERVVKAGDEILLSRGICLEVLAPESMAHVPTEKELSDNDSSLVLRLVRDGRGLAILCGDISTPALGSLSSSGRKLRAEVLVLPHHGAASGFQKRFYDAVDPEIAAASAGAFNRYDFPSEKVREEMARRSLPLLSTSELGALEIRWGKKGRSWRAAGKAWTP